MRIYSGRGVTRPLIGGGGGGYMNIHPTPTSINALVTPLYSGTSTARIYYRLYVTNVQSGRGRRPQE